ncbi:PP2C family serine/threonine-protein phosphatase [Robertmurraya sp. P23]|uniref:PP2C family serine/threonine-protein phosphatase n=1 Tax=Robertmurraya sp. P23 TaxID=3436931 RepID=UPI003D9806E6
MVTQPVEVIVQQTTKEGKYECGDSYYYVLQDDYFTCVVADGLGSGKLANEASSAVVDVVQQYHDEDVEELMKKCNQALFQKRGAAVAVLKVFFQTKEFHYSCVGNIRFFLYSEKGELTYPLPVSGYLSGKPVRFNTKRYSYQANSKFLIHSDGITPNGVKSLLSSGLSNECIANQLREKFTSKMDDSTFIIGTLH